MREKHFLGTFTFLEPKNSKLKIKIIGLMRGESRQPQELEKKKTI
jgi:hypothetical protein